MARNTRVIELSSRELATVLAALRIFQSEADYDSDAVYGMEQFREAEPLSNDEIDRGQNMDGLVDAADLGHGLCQLGGAVANLESPHY